MDNVMDEEKNPGIIRRVLQLTYTFGCLNRIPTGCNNEYALHEHIPMCFVRNGLLAFILRKINVNLVTQIQ